MRDIGSQIPCFEVPQLVGILNVTPDSFSDGGQYNQLDAALHRAQQMQEEGADWIDIGGESSGPNTETISVQEECQRILPLIQGIRSQSHIYLSIDTYKAEVAYQAIAAGANAINDVTALRGDPELTSVIAEAQVPLILMYSKNDNARTTTATTSYADIIQHLTTFFEERIAFACDAGIAREQIILDPGMGFFVSADPRYSFEIIRRLHELQCFGLPLMVGPSRKSFLANVSPKVTLAVHEREIPTAVATSMAIAQGAQLLRLHNVAQGRLVLDTMSALRGT